MRHLRKEIDIIFKAIIFILGVIIISIDDYDISFIGYYLTGVLIWIASLAIVTKWGRDI